MSIEALFWAVISFVAAYSEVKYITSIDILDFADDLEYDWYYFLIFGHPRETFDERVRSKILIIIEDAFILINFFLSLQHF